MRHVQTGRPRRPGGALALYGPGGAVDRATTGWSYRGRRVALEAAAGGRGEQPAAGVREERN
jgi:hypothetical protein